MGMFVFVLVSVCRSCGFIGYVNYDCSFHQSATGLALSKTWWEALRYCRENHVDLVSVHTEGIQRWVETVARNASTDNVWVGLRHTCAQGWIWSDGSNSSYRDWNTGEPNNKESEICIQLQGTNGYRWADVACHWPNPFVCYDGE
uniref:C-type lectin domain-containing protein n=1 Tax=Astyanax mexicanus TaxID=7994 RepID=A0A3B1JAS5_ASTMX